MCREQCAVYRCIDSVQYAVSSVQCAGCSVQYALWSVECWVCSVQCTVCSFQYAIWSLQCAVLCAVCSRSRQWTMCIHECGVCIVLDSVCNVPCLGKMSCHWVSTLSLNKHKGHTIPRDNGLVGAKQGGKRFFGALYSCNFLAWGRFVQHFTLLLLQNE